MSLVPYDPFRRFMEQWEKEVVRLMNTNDLGSLHHHSESLQIKFHETDQEVIVVCKLPGLKRIEDVQVYVTRDTLAVVWKQHSMLEVKSKDGYRKQEAYGRYQRDISLAV